MASPRPARLISRRAGRTTPVATRGWMGGVSRRAASSLAPEISICLPSETPNKSPSLTRLQVRAGLHKGRELSRRTELLFAAFRRIRRDPRIAGISARARVFPGPRQRRGLRALAAWPRCRSLTLVDGVESADDVRRHHGGVRRAVDVGVSARKPFGAVPT